MVIIIMLMEQSTILFGIQIFWSLSGKLIKIIFLAFCLMLKKHVGFEM